MMRLLVLIIVTLPLLPYGKTNCQLPEFRQFDFWLGEWQVTTKSDDIVRNNHITSINHGCALLEEYSTDNGYVGKSLNIYDKASNRWHQRWTDSAGNLLQLSGGMIGDSMVMTGTSYSESGRLLNKITWTALANGKSDNTGKPVITMANLGKPSLMGCMLKVSDTA